MIFACHLGRPKIILRLLKLFNYSSSSPIFHLMNEIQNGRSVPAILQKYCDNHFTFFNPVQLNEGLDWMKRNLSYSNELNTQQGIKVQPRGSRRMALRVGRRKLDFQMRCDTGCSPDNVHGKKWAITFKLVLFYSTFSFHLCFPFSLLHLIRAVHTTSR